MAENSTIPAWIAETDIYLIDQIAKERFAPGSKILDAGCGAGRNLSYFLEGPHMVFGNDVSAEAIEITRKKAKTLNPEIPGDNFRVEAIENTSFESIFFDAVICNAVLHFAKDTNHFKVMVDQLWRVLKPGGIFFCRLATSIGIENRIKNVNERTYLLPDGTKRFLADETMLLRATHTLNAAFLEPIKTVNVQNTRCMTTWVLQKR